jgi:hypothetical protein
VTAGSWTGSWSETAAYQRDALRLLGGQKGPNLRLMGFHSEEVAHKCRKVECPFLAVWLGNSEAIHMSEKSANRRLRADNKPQVTRKRRAFLVKLACRAVTGCWLTSRE